MVSQSSVALLEDYGSRLHFNQERQVNVVKIIVYYRLQVYRLTDDM